MSCTAAKPRRLPRAVGESPRSAADIGKHWPELPVARKRAVLAALIERIEVKVDQIDGQQASGRSVKGLHRPECTRSLWKGASGRCGVRRISAN
jgi:hypothetical protein